MTQTPSEAVGANVRAEMARRKVPQREIAACLGLSQAAVSKRLNGDVPWDVNELAVVADALVMSVASLLGETSTAGAA